MALMRASDLMSDAGCLSALYWNALHMLLVQALHKLPVEVLHNR